MPPATRDLIITLPEEIADELDVIAEHSSMTDVVENALALVKIADDASKNNQKLMVTDQRGRPVWEIKLIK